MSIKGRDQYSDLAEFSEKKFREDYSTRNSSHSITQKAVIKAVANLRKQSPDRDSFTLAEIKKEIDRESFNLLNTYGSEIGDDGSR